MQLLKLRAVPNLGTYLLEVQVALLGSLVILSSHLATLHIVKLLSEAAAVEPEPCSCRRDGTAGQRRDSPVHRECRGKGLMRNKALNLLTQAARPQVQTAAKLHPRQTYLHNDVILLQGSPLKEARQHILGASSIAGLQQEGCSAQLVCPVVTGTSRLSVKCSIGVAISDTVQRDAQTGESMSTMESKGLHLSIQRGARVVRGHGMVGPAGQSQGRESIISIEQNEASKSGE